MKLRDYVWSGNPRGLIAQGPFVPIDHDQATALRLGWVKILSGTDEYLEDVKRLIRAGVTPIIQMVRERIVGEPCPQDLMKYMISYANAGVKFFEYYSEPNLPANWPASSNDSNTLFADDASVKRFVDSWLDWAEKIVQLGAYPAFPAMNELDANSASAFTCLNASISLMKLTREERFLRIAQSGLFLAVHPQIKNLFYQEMPCLPNAPRPPASMTAGERGWHFEFPEDPLLQGVNASGVDEVVPTELQNGLLSSSRIFQFLLKKYFGLQPVPVIAVGGGLPLFDAATTFYQADRLYPAVTRESFVESQIALWDWIAVDGPDWLLGYTFPYTKKLVTGGEAYQKLAQRLAEILPALKIYSDESTAEAKATRNTHIKEQAFLKNPSSTKPYPDEESEKTTLKLAFATEEISGNWISLEQQSLEIPEPRNELLNTFLTDLPEKRANWIYLTPHFSPELFLTQARSAWNRLNPTIVPNLELLIYPPSDVVMRVIILSPDAREGSFYEQKAISLRSDAICDVIISTTDSQNLTRMLEDLI